MNMVSSVNYGTVALAVVASLALVSVVACEDLDFYQPEHIQPGANLLRRTHFGRGPFFLEGISDDELLNELAIRRGLLSGVTSPNRFSDNRRIAGRRPRIVGLPFQQQLQQAQQPGQQQQDLPEDLPHQQLASGALGAFDKGEPGAIGGELEVEREREQDQMQADKKKVGAGQLKASFTDKEAKSKKMFSADSKTGTNVKHVSASEDHRFHDRERRLEADVMAAENSRLSRDKETESVKEAIAKGHLSTLGGVKPSFEMGDRL